MLLQIRGIAQPRQVGVSPWTLHERWLLSWQRDPSRAPRAAAARERFPHTAA